MNEGIKRKSTMVDVKRATSHGTSVLTMLSSATGEIKAQSTMTDKIRLISKMPQTNVNAN